MTVIGLYYATKLGISLKEVEESEESVEDAVDRLKTDGFRNTDISVLFPDKSTTHDLAQEKSTQAPEGTVAGAGSANSRKTPMAMKGWPNA